ncbi:GntR family transcriptional regulator [Salsuginibacillus halophilus]|uniref:GntR family transcriptional regulator n=1 Tax=Salsuginibacillus halophilus TaxID=517424 RepID=A0A2P8HKZ9_9BACI|nr:GntR family transcriptional regulator [Salsuginibacillus halophilus]PSL46889.1 GntR family transcriptional regulator [Salsuginibacillus halophilus]
MLSTKIDPNRGPALYLQVKDVLIENIQQGDWEENELIPTEQELIKTFDVSRTTIRQAINILVQEGMLEKRQGHGTVVKPKKLIGSLGRLKGFAEEVVEKGKTPRSKLLRAEFKYDLYYEKDALNTGEDEPILLLERIRFADDTPVALERTCWPQEVGEVLMAHDLNEARYYELLEDANILLKNASEKIRAINATIDEADALGIRPGEALLEMTRLSFGMNGAPIEFTKTKYRSDQYHYDIELHR